MPHFQALGDEHHTVDDAAKTDGLGVTTIVSGIWVATISVFDQSLRVETTDEQLMKWNETGREERNGVIATKSHGGLGSEGAQLQRSWLRKRFRCRLRSVREWPTCITNFI